MSSIAFVLGNGESRRGIEINDLKERGTVFACNGVYRTHRPHWLDSGGSKDDVGDRRDRLCCT